MMKNKSIIAKLLAEEDIFVVYKKMETAYFNPKSRELGLPIWNDEMMTPNIEDLMVCHEIAHALWTPLDMLEQARVRKINHSFVNIIEDVRIEQKVQERYRGSVAVFNRGYDDLAAKDFFGIDDKDVSKLNLIDRINLFFKIGSRKQKIEFSDEENVWVKKVSKCETPDDVLNVAEELYKWMKENEPEEEQEEASSQDNSADDSAESSDETNDMNSDTSSSEPSEEEEEEELAPSNSGSADGDKTDDAETKEASDNKSGDEENNDASIKSAANGADGKDDITASTDTDVNNAIEKLIDENATDRVYANIPDISGDDIIIKYDDILKKSTSVFTSFDETDSPFYLNTKEAVVDMKADSKKTVAYMVKEFEMKKSADQYARASVSKSGSLDMNRLHTYKYNEDLFKKVTTLPGATNHGMVMVVDWSGSMYQNLTGTLSQLYNLIWFCRRTQIPFEVYAFSNASQVLSSDEKGYNKQHLESFKAGNLVLDNMKLLNFFSNKMTVDQEMSMMHYLWMVANQYNHYKNEYGYPCNIPSIFNMASTPLNEAIIAMMNIVPKFRKETGVQKVNTIFLTDGASNSNRRVYDYSFDEKENEHYETEEYLGKGGDKVVILSDPKTRKDYEIKSLNRMTDNLLTILKERVVGMNLIGFFIAGSGRSGRIDRQILSWFSKIPSYSDEMAAVLKKTNKEKFYVVNGDITGYDELYLLAGGSSLQVENGGLSDDLQGASKAKLKSAFGKSMKSKITSRQLLNKFVKLVA